MDAFELEEWAVNPRDSDASLEMFPLVISTFVIFCAIELVLYIATVTSLFPEHEKRQLPPLNVAPPSQPVEFPLSV